VSDPIPPARSPVKTIFYAIAEATALVKACAGTDRRFVRANRQRTYFSLPVSARNKVRLNGPARTRWGGGSSLQDRSVLGVSERTIPVPAYAFHWH